MLEKKTLSVLPAEHRKVIEKFVGYAGRSDKERSERVVQDQVTHVDTIFAVLREALHVLDHGGELTQACRDKFEERFSHDATSPLGQAARALLQALDVSPTPIERTPAVATIVPDKMRATEIIPRLFLGGREDAEALGPRVPDDWACVSVTEYRSRYKRREELPSEPEGSLDMPFMVDAPDGWYADPHKLDLIAETIWWRLQIGKKVLVHCIHAQERTPLVVAWYLSWSGAAPSMAQAYATVERLHPRTKRRDKWLRGATPKSFCPELAALLAAARACAIAASQFRTEAAARLEAAAGAWVARKT